MRMSLCVCKVRRLEESLPGRRDSIICGASEMHECETTEVQHCLSIKLEHSVLRDKAAEVGVAQLWRILLALMRTLIKI